MREIENDLFELMIDTIGVCKPDSGYSLKDIYDTDCKDICDKYEICKLIIRDKIF